MAVKKATLKKFQGSFNVKMQVTTEVEASTVEEATEKFRAIRIHDLIDFESNGLEHCDSDPLDLYSVYRMY